MIHSESRSIGDGDEDGDENNHEDEVEEGETSFCCLMRSYHVVLVLASSAKLYRFLLLDDYFQSLVLTD